MSENQVIEFLLNGSIVGSFLGLLYLFFKKK